MNRVSLPHATPQQPLGAPPRRHTGWRGQPRPRRRRRRSLLAVLASAAILALAACAVPAPMLQESGGVGGAEPAGDLSEFYSQTVQWSSCGRDFECGAVTVPIDYAQPEGGTIEIHMKKYGLPSAEGIVLTNPGGPGGSGIELVEVAAQVFSPALRQEREIVGFDPRGVGQSAPISCYDDAELDDWYTTLYDVDTPAGWEAYLEAVGAYIDACVENNSELIAHVDTVSAARDMDIIRAALGLDTLDYIGYSYGTKLGATYADLFGENVGKFVLDSALDLSLDAGALALGQLHGFERAYRVFLEDCLAGPNCPFVGTVDEAYDDTLLLAEQLAERPANTGDPDRPATNLDLMNAIVLSLYSTDNWPLLTSALGAIQRGDGGQVKFLSDFAIERDADGRYPPSDGAMLAINCLDHPHPADFDYEELLAEAEEFEEISPLFGSTVSFHEVACATFPIKSEHGPRAIAAPQAPTMLVIGITGDPATPYAWAEAMAAQLDDAVLITYEGEGHTAYANGSCIDEAVDGFLLDGILPEDGLRC